MTFKKEQLFVASTAIAGFDKADEELKAKLWEFFEFTLGLGASLYIQRAAIALCEAGEINAVPVVQKSLTAYGSELMK